MATWEYKVVVIKNYANQKAVENELNALGLMGWELVQIWNADIAYLKKER